MAKNTFILRDMVFWSHLARKLNAFSSFENKGEYIQFKRISHVYEEGTVETQAQLFPAEDSYI